MSKRLIDECIRASLEQYFEDLRGTEPAALHAMIRSGEIDHAIVVCAAYHLLTRG